MVFYVNRKNRKRHADPNCRALRLTREYLVEMHESGMYEGLDDDEIPTYERRVVRVETRNADELRAVEAFTVPCQWCVSGAKALWELFPIDFEQ